MPDIGTDTEVSEPERASQDPGENEESELRPGPKLVALGIFFLLLGILAGLILSTATFR